MTKGAKRLTGFRWVYISAVGLVISIFSLFAILLFAQGEMLSDFSGILFYIILLPFGLAASGFLFGALKSYAKASGKNIHGTLELGGPVVLFVLLLYGGIYFQNHFNPTQSFVLNVYFYGDAQKAVLINDGYARFITDGMPITKPISQEGVVPISLSSNMRGELLSIDASVDGYKKDQIQLTIPAEDNKVDVVLQQETYVTSVSGYILDRSGQVPEGSYMLEWAGIQTNVDENGKYTLDLPFQPGTIKNLKIFRESVLVYNLNQAIQEGEFDIMLKD